MTRINITASALAVIVEHATAATPQECCGLLLGRGDTIQVAVRASNRSSDPTRRYKIDPQDHFAAIREGRGRGLEVVGAYHSHPHSDPVPSETDRAEAFEHFLFLIAGRGDERRFATRAWQLRSGNFVELPLVCEA